ncbi:MAG: DUF255 domain-containing protein [Epsilonproteobacteria bacterium]|nr:DUF255 domain-containing protein [Campylobacterota bacterium]
MKRAFLTLFIVFTSLTAKVEWREDFKRAYEESLKNNKPLFVFIWRENPPCRWCNLMKKKTLNDPEISTYINEKFIPVMVVKGKDNYPSELIAPYVPTIYVIFKDEVIKRVVGYWSKEDFKSDLRDIERALDE